LCPDRPKRNRDRCDKCAICGGREPILGFPARPGRARPTAGAVPGFHGRCWTGPSPPGGRRFGDPGWRPSAFPRPL